MKRLLLALALALLPFCAVNAQTYPMGVPSPPPGCSALAGSTGVINGCTGATTGQQALSNLSGVYVLCKSAGQVSHTGDANEFILGSCTVPANALGANGHLRITYQSEWTSSANSKTFRVHYSGIGGTIFNSQGFTTSAVARIQTEIANNNATNAQLGMAAGSSGLGSGGAAITSAVDTTAATSIVITGQLVTTSETVSLDYFVVELITTAGN